MKVHISLLLCRSFFSVKAEYHQKTGQNPDVNNINVLFTEDKMIPRKVTGNFHKERDQPYSK